MTKWCELHMRDLMTEFHDGPHATPKPASDGPVYLGIKNITDNGALDLSEIRHIDEEDYATWTRRVTPRAGDVVFTYEATLHRYALIPEGFRGCLGRRLALIRPDHSVVLPRFLHFVMLGPVWRTTISDRIISGSTVDRIPIIDFPNFPVTLPDLDVQQGVVAVLGAMDDLIENNLRRVLILEEIARSVYQEWFVRFRYPCDEDAVFVESPLGPIPDGWKVRRVEEVASNERHAVTGGPFGSKLGRKDYRAEGVPVLRGVNLGLGGGFYESELVFVSEEKADELRSSIARPGDVVVTQRGTLGQVGLIPSRSRFDRYVLSQSQMKVTVDPNISEVNFFYAQMCSKETTERFVAQAMTAGVPHVNLALLRQFEVIVPPEPLQRRFSQAVEPIWAEARLLSAQRESLVILRDFLLPKLVTGQIDVSGIDLETLVVESVA